MAMAVAAARPLALMATTMARSGLNAVAGGKENINVDIQRATVAAFVPMDEEMQQSIAVAATESGRDVRGDISVRIVDEAEMTELNHRYRGKQRSTNVLAFPAELGDLPGLPASDAGLLGDLVICAPVVAREAAEQGKPEAVHWAHMVVHGMLHLLGYDHETDAEAKEMESLEIAALARLGVENPYKIKRLT